MVMFHPISRRYFMQKYYMFVTNRAYLAGARTRFVPKLLVIIPCYNCHLMQRYFYEHMAVFSLAEFMIPSKYNVMSLFESV